MIDEDRTMQLYGYTSDILKLHSGKPIIRVCNECGNYSVVRKNAYHDLCKSCSHKNPTDETRKKMSEAKIGRIGYKHTQEQKDKWSRDRKGKQLSNKTKGKLSKPKITLTCKYCNNKFKVRPSSINKKFCSLKCRGRWQSKNLIGEYSSQWKGGIANNRNHLSTESICIKLNTKIKGFDFHHITKSSGIYIPHYLHKSIWHDLKNNKNMIEINSLAMNYLLFL